MPRTAAQAAGDVMAILRARRGCQAQAGSPARQKVQICDNCVVTIIDIRQLSSHGAGDCGCAGRREPSPPERTIPARPQSPQFSSPTPEGAMRGRRSPHPDFLRAIAIAGPPRCSPAAGAADSSQAPQDQTRTVLARPVAFEPRFESAASSGSSRPASRAASASASAGRWPSAS